MPRYPAAVWRPLPENHDQPRGDKHLVIVHSAVGRGSLHSYFGRVDVGLESTFWVSKTGVVEQYLDTTVRADANRNANGRAISIETEDDGDPDRQPWTVAQLDALVELIAWCCRTHPIPPTRATGPNGQGVGFHTMWGAPSPWTPVAKTCPGAIRIQQFDEVLLPRLTHNLAQEDHDMTPEQARQLDDLHAVFVRNRIQGAGDTTGAHHDLATPILSTNHEVGIIKRWVGAVADKLGVPR